MYRITGWIEGVAPILFSRWTDTKGLEGAGAGGGKHTEEERLTEAMLKVYRNSVGTLIFPAWNFKKCLLEGSNRAGLKEGRAAMSKFLEPTVFVEGECSFNVDEPDYIHEVTGRRPPRTGNACLIKRPALSAGWRMSFGLSVVDDRRSADHIHKALDEAGFLVGLGSWRPEYGRFVVREFNVQRP